MNLCKICPVGWYNDWKLKRRAKKVLIHCLRQWATNRFWNAVGETHEVNKREEISKIFCRLIKDTLKRKKVKK